MISTSVKATLGGAVLIGTSAMGLNAINDGEGQEAAHVRVLAADLERAAEQVIFQHSFGQPFTVGSVEEAVAAASVSDGTDLMVDMRPKGWVIVGKRGGAAGFEVEWRSGGDRPGIHVIEMREHRV